MSDLRWIDSFSTHSVTIEMLFFINLRHYHVSSQTRFFLFCVIYITSAYMFSAFTIWTPCLINDMPSYEVDSKIAHLMYPSCSRISSHFKKTFHTEVEKDACLFQLLLLKYYANVVQGTKMDRWGANDRGCGRINKCMLKYAAHHLRVSCL